MDTIILLLTFCFLFAYVFIQRIYLKKIPFEKRVAWQKKILILITLCSFICSSVILQQRYSLLLAFEVSFIISLIVGLCCVVYILSIFSFLESSITIKILSLFPSNQQQITRNHILSTYSIHEIISRRLKRFVFENVLTQKKLVYTYKEQPYSLFIIREYFYTVTQWLFP